MNTAGRLDDPLLVACLCAAWCHVCNDYRATFDALAVEFGEQSRFVWVDIEDDEQALGAVDVADFPTLLLADGDEVRFFGPVTPHAQAARQLVQRALQGRLGVIADAAAAGLPARVRKLR
jgi:thiol-disulfide isomerase/thioredoxin